jgi:hypothetical protein
MAGATPSRLLSVTASRGRCFAHGEQRDGKTDSFWVPLGGCVLPGCSPLGVLPGFSGGAGLPVWPVL